LKFARAGGARHIYPIRFPAGSLHGRFSEVNSTTLSRRRAVVAIDIRYSCKTRPWSARSESAEYPGSPSEATGTPIERADRCPRGGARRRRGCHRDLPGTVRGSEDSLGQGAQFSRQRARVPTRAEVTDAAMASRAECVMLNKGPHIAEAIRMLDDVLDRMESHQHKKTPQLRVLHSWQTALGPEEPPPAPDPDVENLILALWAHQHVASLCRDAPREWVMRPRPRRHPLHFLPSSEVVSHRPLRSDAMTL
jgi:hypothetical protein